MTIAFLTEMGFSGKIPADHPNMRTEFAWIFALDAVHFNVYHYPIVKGFDFVFIIFPKGTVSLNAVGSDLLPGSQNTDSKLFESDITDALKRNNGKVCFIQEGPHWFFNDYTLPDQFNYYNQLQNCDILFTHNESDKSWYRGLFPGKRVETIPSLLINTLIKDITPVPENKVIIGGNFSRWYGGFQSYMVADEFEAEKWIQTSHSSRPGENQIPDLKVLPRLIWVDWMKALSTFKYAINLMPTAAAGTFSLNCSYFGIPCIGNEKLDTQRMCYPSLSVDVENVEAARLAVKNLKLNYHNHSKVAKDNYLQFFSLDKWKDSMFNIMKD